MTRIKSMPRSRRSLVFALVILVAASAPLFAGGGKETETQIQLSRPPAYISPGNPATGHDSLTIDKIKLTIDPKGAIKSYTLNIYNKNGEIIFTRAEAKLQGRGFFGDLLDIGDVPQVKVPDSFNWPGTSTQDGKIVPDGEYFYQLTVLDSFGKKTSTAPLSVVVDTKSPQVIDLSNNFRIFSPNGDGIRDSITFRHKTDTAYKWTESIIDQSGAIVWSNETTAPGDTAASDIVFTNDTVWDGIANKTAGAATAGAVVPEGNYVYRFAGTDRAGNVGSKDLPFIISFSMSDIGLGIMGDNPVFNPVKGITFTTEAGDTKGLVSWTLEISDADKIIYRRLTGNGEPPATIIFNGKGQAGRPDGEGIQLRDGDYFATLKTHYDSGAQSTTDGLPITLDATAPFARLTLDSAPEGTAHGDALVIGNGNKAQLKWTLVYDADLVWNVRLTQLNPSTSQALPDAEQTVKEMPLAMLVATMETVSSEPGSDKHTLTTLLWSGDLPPSSDSQATKLPDGLWQIDLVSQDKAGNDGKSNPVRFIMDSTGTVTAKPDTTVQTETKPSLRAMVTAEPSIFSPDGDGVADSVNLMIDSNGSAISSWKLEVLDPMQHGFRTWSGDGAPPASVAWDGKSDSGELVQSAMDYTALLTVSDADGNSHRSMATVTTDILVVKDGDRLKIALPNIEFPGNSYDLFENGRLVLDQNLDTLRRLARILNRYGDYQISIEGHATHVRNNSQAEIDREQVDELLPLSKRRALEVKQALNILNVGWDRMYTVGYGGDRPVVPHTDLENRWKNRRVEFILERK